MNNFLIEYLIYYHLDIFLYHSCSHRDGLVFVEYDNDQFLGVDDSCLPGLSFQLVATVDFLHGGEIYYWLIDSDAVDGDSLLRFLQNLKTMLFLYPRIMKFIKFFKLMLLDSVQ